MDATQTLTLAQNQVRDFMAKAGQELPGYPTMPRPNIRILRIKLIAEELLELCLAMNIELTINQAGVRVIHPLNVESDITDLIAAYDGILDILVVTIGTALACGLDLERGWLEVHRSNMSKFIDGHRRRDGKWVKGPSYSPAQLHEIVATQK